QHVVRQNFEELKTAISVKISEVLAGFDTRDGLDAIKENLKKLDEDTVRRGIIVDLVEALQKCMARYELEVRSVSMIRDYSHTMERHVIKSVLGDEKADKFPNGFNDVLESPLLSQKDRDTLTKQFSRVTEGFNAAIGDALDRCRQNDANDQILYNTFQGTTWKILDEVANDKEWKKQAVPILKALAKKV
ncbi:MAG: hypothetical protein IJS08_17795, partial [Victivallales bacterium]|nr:hypothetical protein [Victivallales bacterium]